MACVRSCLIMLFLVATLSMPSAWEIDTMIGLNLFHFNFPAPQVQANISSPPLLGILQPELGLSYIFFFGLWSEVDIVARLWFLFPQSTSIPIRDKLRVGIEFSPIVASIFINATLWFPGFKPALCGSFTISRPERKVRKDIITSLGVMITPEKDIDGINVANIYAYIGFMWRFTLKKPRNELSSSHSASNKYAEHGAGVDRVGAS